MWCVKLTETQRDALEALLKAQGELGRSLAGALDAIGLARWDDLPEAELDWDRVRALAEAQGIGEGDVVWDLAAGLSGHCPRPGKTAKPAAKRAGARRTGR